ncbi:hypothetical protein SK128_003706 [Halocaridina rubra]|uniref:Uncharacterized protein n=1 Tax=Halocaridina rubra TaxID=373956 RepID=A0AAN9ADF8_HALRR
MWSILAGMILRLKVLWLPSVCIACGVFINDCRLYNYIFFKCGRLLSHLPRWFPAFFKVAVGLGFAAALAYMYQGQISSDIWPDEVYEFWDPDTVELMEWINHYTPPDVVFAGSMQLLASVKLCTGRHIANHPHYEDAWLRHRTHDASLLEPINDVG